MGPEVQVKKKEATISPEINLPLADVKNSGSQQSSAQNESTQYTTNLSTSSKKIMKMLTFSNHLYK